MGEDRTWMDERAEGPHRGRGPRGWTASDARIREEVCERLLHDALLDAHGIAVEVKEGLVTLSGVAPGASDPAHAEMLARQAPGVRDVLNRVRCDPSVRRPPGRGPDDDKPHHWAPALGG